MSLQKPRVAMLTHSTNPRGGVVHALELSEALGRLGHEVVLHAPDPRGTGFFRPTVSLTVSVAATSAAVDMTAMVLQRIDEYVAHFRPAAMRRFDIYHAHDGISGNALAILKARGLIPGFVRTVHHVDDFADARLMALQDRSIVNADVVMTVSDAWRRHLWDAHGLVAELGGNGVDTRRYTSVPSERDAGLRQRLDLGAGPVFLVVGGVEERKNTRRILEAFLQVHAMVPTAKLVIAGGASILDHAEYQGSFDNMLQATGLAGHAVTLIGPVPDIDMPALYRLADALVFASLKEGFGLCVVEAMASGTPVVVSRIAPFTEYLGSSDVVWCDPLQIGSIADAMLVSLGAETRRRLVISGAKVAARHDWDDIARRHVPSYLKILEAENA